MHAVETPRTARLVLRLVLDPVARRLIAADLDEEYASRMMPALGRFRARWWYLRMAVASVWAWWRQYVARDRSLPSSDRAMLRDLRLDARHAFRLMRRSPLVSATVVLTMVLGIGSSAAMASVLINVLLRPLPFSESDRIVRFERTTNGVPSGFGVVGLPDMEDWRERSTSMDAIAGWSPTGVTHTGPNRGPARIRAALVTADLGRVLRVSPALGRGFVSENHFPSGRFVTILTHGFWLREFGGDSAVVGRSVTLDGNSFEIVGVLPEMEFDYPDRVELWLPMALPPDTWQRSIRGASWMTAIGRVRGGWSLAAAQAELSQIQRQLVSEFPRQNDGQDGIAFTPLKTATVADAQKPLWLLTAAVSGLLLVACANIALLLLARAQRRRHEFSVRTALGGNRARLLRQLFTEAIVLASIGGPLGVAIAPAIMAFLVRHYPGGLPRSSEVVLDPVTLGLAAAVVLIVSVAAAMLPWLYTARRNLAAALQVRERTPAARQVGGRRFLTAVQLAIAVVFLVGAALFQRTLSNLSSQDVGFGTTNVLTFDLSLPSARYGQSADIDRFTEELRAGLSSLAGAVEVGAVTALPFSLGGIWGGGFAVPETSDRQHEAMVRVSWPDYYSAMRIPVVSGRAIDDRDHSASARVAMLNEAAAVAAFGPVNPVGRHVEFQDERREIVGLVADIKHAGLGEMAAPEIHVPGRQFPRRSFTVALRFSADASQVLTGARDVVRRLDPELAVTDVATMEERIRASVAAERFRAILMTAIGLALAGVTLVGVYGIAASGVTERRREIGVRIALGADRTRVLLDVLRDSGRLAAAGGVVGLVVSAALLGFVRDYLFEIGPYNPYILLGAPTLLLGVSLLSALPAAFRASRSDPAVVLRDE